MQLSPYRLAVNGVFKHRYLSAATKNQYGEKNTHKLIINTSRIKS
ncbi:hypothetical protein XNC3_1510006 [Xenorhabdus nematophila F1]|nr:hypothetical protein XNC3_1510006 [Xenorhabdus nematophila F1]CEF30514.1 hypothetical protein XNW1_2620005 [Xenorhabdus nematophila str. Websteri]